MVPGVATLDRSPDQSPRVKPISPSHWELMGTRRGWPSWVEYRSGVTFSFSVNIFSLEGGETKFAWDKGNFHAPGENRTCDPASFCQQVDDWIDYDRPSNNRDKLVPSI